MSILRGEGKLRQTHTPRRQRGPVRVRCADRQTDRATERWRPVREIRGGRKQMERR